MTRCVHCLRSVKVTTKDHVFPSSWFPDSTQEDVQRWTVPSCSECNKRLSRFERELLIRMGLCVDPMEWKARGISKKALRSLGVGIEQELSAREETHRRAKKQSILSQLQPFTPEDMLSHVLPGFGPREAFPVEDQPAVLVPAEALTCITEKILRGCEFKLAGERYVEPPYELQVFFPVQEAIDQGQAFLASATVTELGPGLEVRRRAADDDPLNVLYRLHIWGTLTTFGSILKPCD